MFEVKRWLEPYVLKGTSTVLREEKSRKALYLLDNYLYLNFIKKCILGGSFMSNRIISVKILRINIIMGGLL
jgi:hypothetical protein